MKRRDVIKRLEENGYHFVRNGNNHDIYFNEVTKITIPLKRHREIEDEIAREIFKQAKIN